MPSSLAAITCRTPTSKDYSWLTPTHLGSPKTTCKTLCFRTRVPFWPLQRKPERVKSQARGAWSETDAVSAMMPKGITAIIAGAARDDDFKLPKT